jgi:type II secretory pathway pseudopilin PulG
MSQSATVVSRSPRRFARRRPAFVLLEMMITVALFTVFSIVAFRLVSTTLRIGNEASRAEIAHRLFDAAIAHVREDVWTASVIDVHGPGGVTLDLGRDGGGKVTWSVAADGSLVRTLDVPGADPARQNWIGAGDGVTFRADPAGVVLDLQHRGHDSGAYRLVSQVRLASEGKP